MKLIIAIILMITVLSNELMTIIDISGVEDFHIDTCYEGEVEKDCKEGLEDFSKVKIRQNVNFIDPSFLNRNRNLFSKWTISTPYLEIHSPPPDSF